MSPRRWSAHAPLAALLAACSSAPGGEAPSVPIVEVAATATTPLTFEDDNWPPPRVRPSLAACRIQGGRAPHLGSLELRASPDGASFGALRPDKIVRHELVIGAGERRAALMSVDGARARLTGYIDPDAVVIHPAEALQLGQLVIPKPTAELSWTEATGGSLRVRYQTDLGLGAPLVVTERISCKALTLDRPRFDPLAELLTARAAERARLKPGRHPLHREAIGQPAAELSLHNGPHVWVIEERAARIRIAWERQREVLVGWVPASAVVRGAPAARGLVGAPPRQRQPAAAAEPQGLHCPEPLPLVIGRRDALVTIGTLQPGARWSRRSERRELPGLDEPLVRIETPDLPVALEPGARLWARASDLDACRSSG